MFTGIVEEIGTVRSVTDLGDSVRMTIAAPRVLEDARLGDSIAVNGVCLTVAERTADTFDADLMKITLDNSNLGALNTGSRVNLERALAAGERLGGHIMQGHVDGTAGLRSRTPSEHWDVLRFDLPADLSPYLVTRGSIALNGTSLTIAGLGEDWFEVSLIPTTLAETTHGDLEVGETVNLEVDVLGKYVERMLRHGVAPGVADGAGGGAVATGGPVPGTAGTAG
ncbi:riboflavin synthase [Corynebacterium halotolerans]|uniref:riboflavin synthase n=1 Tax=Corynebacterium halotolerans TaxID=225326 RepID=UPI003CF680E6